MHDSARQATISSVAKALLLFTATSSASSCPSRSAHHSSPTPASPPGHRARLHTALDSGIQKRTQDRKTSALLVYLRVTWHRLLRTRSAPAVLLPYTKALLFDMSSPSPTASPKEPEEVDEKIPTPDGDETQPRAEEADTMDHDHDNYPDFEVKEQDRWLPIANGE